MSQTHEEATQESTAPVPAEEVEEAAATDPTVEDKPDASEEPAPEVTNAPDSAASDAVVSPDLDEPTDPAGAAPAEVPGGDHDAAQDEDPEHDATEHEAAEHDGPRDDAVEHEAAEHDGPRDDAVEHEAAEHDGPRDGAAEQDEPEDEVSQRDLAEHDGAGGVAVGHDEPQDEVVDDDAVGDDAVELDEPQDEAPEGSTGSSRRSRRAPSRELLEKEGEIAADFLESLLDICDLDGDIDVDIDGDRAAVSIVDSDEGRVPRRLVGADGKVLDALQELTRLAVYSSTGERSRLILDIAGHRADRRTILVAQASTAITAVKETGEQQALEPMSAFERKIVHDEVLAAGLRSESDGVEPRRFVVVLPA